MTAYYIVAFGVIALGGFLAYLLLSKKDRKTLPKQKEETVQLRESKPMLVPPVESETVQNKSFKPSDVAETVASKYRGIRVDNVQTELYSDTHTDFTKPTDSAHDKPEEEEVTPTDVF